MNSEKIESNNEKKAGGDALYSLIPLEDFNALLGVDDRENRTARFCLVTPTLTIKQCCIIHLISYGFIIRHTQKF